MRRAVPPIPPTPSWGGAQLKKHWVDFTFTFIRSGKGCYATRHTTDSRGWWAVTPSAHRTDFRPNISVKRTS